MGAREVRKQHLFHRLPLSTLRYNYMCQIRHTVYHSGTQCICLSGKEAVNTYLMRLNCYASHMGRNLTEHFSIRRPHIVLTTFAAWSCPVWSAYTHRINACSSIVTTAINSCNCKDQQFPHKHIQVIVYIHHRSFNWGNWYAFNMHGITAEIQWPIKTWTSI